MFTKSHGNPFISQSISLEGRNVNLLVLPEEKKGFKKVSRIHPAGTINIQYVQYKIYLPLLFVLTFESKLEQTNRQSKISIHPSKILSAVWLKRNTNIIIATNVFN